MKVLITGGGSAGHITPLLAIAAELKKRHPQMVIRYVGQYGDPMRQLIADTPAIDKCYSIMAGKWRRYHGLKLWRHVIDVKMVIKNLRDAIFFGLGFLQSFGIMVFWRPKAVFVKGGYVGLPVGLAAALLRIPIVTHDSDAVPGLTNKLLSRFASALAVGLPPEAYTYCYPTEKLHFTGVPIRPEFFTVLKRPDLKESLGFKANDQIITIIGGSLGAMRLNEVIMKCLDELLADANRQLIWITGSRQYDDIKRRLDKQKGVDSRIHIFSFIDDVQKFMAVSNVVISRAGATAIAELAALAKPLILVPNPLLTNAHQLKNAALLEAQQAALVIHEPALVKNPQLLAEAVDKIISDIRYQTILSQNLHKLAVPDAAVRIVEVIERVL